MTTTTQNWKFFLERDDEVWDVRLFGLDGFVGLQLGRWSFGIEAFDDGAVSWSTPLRWLLDRCRAALPVLSALEPQI
jgi:hypothetical protein